MQASKLSVAILGILSLTATGVLAEGFGTLPAPGSTNQAPAMTQPSAGPAQQSAPAEATGSQSVHILVGHAIVIRTQSRLRRVLVGNPAVVTTSTTSPNELVVTATGPGSSSVVLWQQDNQSRILDVFGDLDVSLLRDAIARNFPGEAIQVEAEEGRVVLGGTASGPPVVDQIAKMAAPFSKDVVNSIRVAAPGRQKQILVKVRFAQVDRIKLSEFGVNFFNTPGTKFFGSTSTQQFAPPTLGNPTQGINGPQSTIALSDLLNIFLFRSDINLGATIKDLQQRNVLEILAEPNLLAANGEPASFLAGGELPYPVVTGTLGSSTVSVQFKPFGVKLEFTGTIEDENTIKLKVFPEVSSLDFANAVTISGFVLPAIATRHAETVVELRNGQSFGIAGLLDKRTTAQYSKVPGIGDVPILGQLFRSKSINNSDSELVVIVTPSIVDPASGQATPAEVPKMPIAPVDTKQFDSKVPKGDK
jgi:pilus assembly protein CpaC